MPNQERKCRQVLNDKTLGTYAKRFYQSCCRLRSAAKTPSDGEQSNPTLLPLMQALLKPTNLVRESLNSADFGSKMSRSIKEKIIKRGLLDFDQANLIENIVNYIEQTALYLVIWTS